MPPDPDMTQSADDRVSKWKKGFIDTDTDDQINVAREEFTEGCPPLCLCLSTRLSSGTSLNTILFAFVSVLTWCMQD